MKNDETFVSPTFSGTPEDAITANVIENINFANFVGYGNLNGGFSLGIFMDENYTQRVTNRVLMGNTLYVNAVWSSHRVL